MYEEHEKKVKCIKKSSMCFVHIPLFLGLKTQIPDLQQKATAENTSLK